MSQIIKFTQSSLQGDYSILTVSEIEIDPMKESQKEQNKPGNIRAQPGEHHLVGDLLNSSSVVFKTCNRKFNKR